MNTAQNSKKLLKDVVDGKVTKAEVARILSVSPRTVGRWIDAMKDDVDVAPKKEKQTDNTVKDVKPSTVQNKEEYRALVTSNSISITKIVDGTPPETVVVDKASDSFNTIFNLLIDNKLSDESVKDAFHLSQPKRMVESFTSGKLKIEPAKGVITFFKDEKTAPYVVNNSLSKRIVEMITKNGADGANALIKFMENLMENPSYRAVNELYGFLEHNDIEITDDGYFYAWKKVRGDYFDIYTNTMRNAPGDSPRVSRNLVDENSEVTCSFGLHVCAKSYLNSYGNSAGNRVVKVKVHPADVVAIPKDYRNAKMRCCGYEIIEDVTGIV